MFLTTNRIGIFDSAFKFRVHYAIKYQPLTHESRRDLFRIFITSSAKDDPLEWMDDACLDKLAAAEFNGRQIQNAVRTAHALAVRSGKRLDVKHLDMPLTAMKAFEVDCEESASSIAASGGNWQRSKRQRLE
jgi:SpoVK/Ycf46/Vps4 family AAA+-type ATPase